jgi:hypothetical protein
MELVEDYPFGESTLSTDHLPLPPPSSFPRHTLHVHLENETKFSQLVPRNLLVAALQASLKSSTPLLAKLQSHAIGQDDDDLDIDHVIQYESQAFLKRSSNNSSSDVPLATPRSTPAANRLTLSASTSGRSIDSMAHPSLTPLLELSEELGTLASRHPASNAMGRNTSSSSTAPKADWDDFSKLGFGDAPETVTKLDLQLSPRDLPLPLSRTPSAIEPIAPTPLALKLKAIREERIEIDDAFLPFVEDSQLDKTSSAFNNILLVRLSTNAALELSEQSPIEWLLLSVSYNPPTPIKPMLSTNLRSSSPSKESTMTKKRFSLGGLTSGFRRSSSMALRDDVGKKSSVTRTAGKGSLGPLEEGSTDLMADGPKKTVIGEMGELLEKPAFAPVFVPADKESGPRVVKQEDTMVADPARAEAREVDKVSRGVEEGEAINTNPEAVVSEGESAMGRDSIATATTTGEAAQGGNTSPVAQSTVLEPSQNMSQGVAPDDKSNRLGRASPTLSNTTQITLPKAAPLETTAKNPSLVSNIEDWHYIAEGGANLVFGYHGRTLDYRNKALRIPKSLNTRIEDDESDISILWRDELLPKLLPKSHLPDVQPVSLDGLWVASLVEHVQHTRPDFRTDVDLSAFTSSPTPVKATLMDDLRTSASDISHTVLAIEIKVSSSHLVLEDRLID